MSNREFAKLLADTIGNNPDLEVMCEVESEIVAEDGYAWWLGNLDTKHGIEVREYSADIGECVVFKDDADYDDWAEDLGLYDIYDEDTGEDDIRKRVDEKANWKKAIFIRITT